MDTGLVAAVLLGLSVSLVQSAAAEILQISAASVTLLSCPTARSCSS